MDTREIKLSYLEELGQEVGELIAQLQEFRKKVDLAISGTEIKGDVAEKP